MTLSNRTIAAVVFLLLGFAGFWIGASGSELRNRCDTFERVGAPLEAACSSTGWQEPVSTVMLILAGLGLIVCVLLWMRKPQPAA